MMVRLAHYSEHSRGTMQIEETFHSQQYQRIFFPPNLTNHRKILLYFRFFSNCMYPVKIPAFKWKAPDHCQIVCRPDVLCQLVCRILTEPGLKIAPRVDIGCVEHVDDTPISFLVNVHTTEGRLSKLLLEEILDEIRDSPQS